MNSIPFKTKEQIDLIGKEVVNRIMPLFRNKLKKVILFGSYARGDFDSESDIDIMVLVDEEDRILNQYIYEVARIETELDVQYDIVLSTLLQDERVFNRHREHLPFYKNVCNEGVILYEQ